MSEVPLYRLKPEAFTVAGDAMLVVVGADVFAERCLIGGYPGFMAQGSGCKVQGSRFRVQNSGSRVQGSGCKVQGSGFRVQSSGFRVQGSGCKVQGSGFRVQASGIRDQS